MSKDTTLGSAGYFVDFHHKTDGQERRIAALEDALHGDGEAYARIAHEFVARR